MKDINSPVSQGKNYRLYIILLVGLCVVFSLYILLKWGQSKTASQKAEEVEDSLTKEHGDEAREAVETYEMNWMSLEMHQDPKSYYGELLTGPLLYYYINHSKTQDDNYWLVPSRTDGFSIRVVDYNDRSMRVIACINQGIDKVDPGGTVTEEYPLHQIINFYVFLLDEGSWKVANVIDITDPKQALQDWDFMSQDLKDITGEISSIVYKSRKTEK
jgi:hypothetical protein